MTLSSINPLSAEAVDEFLAQYWQKKPLLIRQALPDITSPLTADELAGLACEEDVNARLVIEHVDHAADEKPWSVEYGPFDESRFASLPESHWSLLVSDVERHVEEAAALLQRFRFIPDWRLDDLMISYAPLGGSVGPHTDAYDVFLLQLQGQRQWSINCDFDQAQLENTELSILKTFTAEQQWILDAGDMLYLPPNVAHHGIARSGNAEGCMTASIGFRAPTVNAMIQGFSDRLANHIDDTLMYADPELKSQIHSAEITSGAIDKIKQLLQEQYLINTENVQRWIGEFSSEPKVSAPEFAGKQLSSFEVFCKAIQNNCLQQSSESSFLFSRTRQGALLFVDGKSYPMSVDLAETLCQHSIDIAKLINNTDVCMQQVMLDLYHQGALVIPESKND
ncbi:MAG: cupin domain-containing protein [Gammaproteobacteria bacterium]